MIGAYGVTFFGIFFGVAVAAAAAQAFDGVDATVGSGVSAASKRLGAISLWAVMALTVNLLIAFLRERLGFAGALLGGIAGVAWNLATFLVIPVIAFEGLGPIDALKRSASIFRKRWGERITGQVAVGGLIFLIGFVPAMLFVLLGAWGASGAVQWALIAVGVVIGVVAVVIARTVTAVFAVALYRYGAEEGATGPFASQDLESSVARRSPSTATIVRRALALAGALAAVAILPAPAVAEISARQFEAQVSIIRKPLRKKMVSWHPGCPVHITNLRLVTVTHWSFDGKVRTGKLVVHPRCRGQCRDRAARALRCTLRSAG